MYKKARIWTDKGLLRASFYYDTKIRNSAVLIPAGDESAIQLMLLIPAALIRQEGRLRPCEKYNSPYHSRAVKIWLSEVY